MGHRPSEGGCPCFSMDGPTIPREGDQSVHKLGIVSETGREHTVTEDKKAKFRVSSFSLDLETKN